MGQGDGATPDLNALLNLATFAGIAILAIPVVFSDARKRKAAEIDEQAKAAKDGAAADLVNGATKRANHWATRWRWIDRMCLYVGYIFLLGAAAVRVFWPQAA